MKNIRFSETSVTIHQTTRLQIPEHLTVYRGWHYVYCMSVQYSSTVVSADKQHYTLLRPCSLSADKRHCTLYCSPAVVSADKRQCTLYCSPAVVSANEQHYTVL